MVSINVTYTPPADAATTADADAAATPIKDAIGELLKQLGPVLVQLLIGLLKPKA